MQDQGLSRSAEHIWNAWLDLNYAFADLPKVGMGEMIRFEIGSSMERLRAVAEKIEALRDSGDLETDLATLVTRRLSGSCVPPCRRGSSNFGSRCGSARPGARRSPANR